MKAHLTIVTAATLVLAGALTMAKAQQATDDQGAHETHQTQQDQQGQDALQQGQGMMGSGMGMSPEMMQMMHRMMMGQQGARSGMMEQDQLHGMGHGGMMRIMFAVVDADGDAALSLQEVQEAHARIFSHVDADDDGKVTLEEIHTFARRGPVAGAADEPNQ